MRRLILCLPLLLAACVGDPYVQVSFSPEPGVDISPDNNAAQRSSAVKILSAFPAEPYQVLGRVVAWGDYQNGEEEYLSRMKLEAAKVGGDAVVVEKSLTGFMRRLPFAKPNEMTGIVLRTPQHRAKAEGEEEAANRQLENFTRDGPMLKELAKKPFYARPLIDTRPERPRR